MTQAEGVSRCKIRDDVTYLLCYNLFILVNLKNMYSSNKLSWWLYMIGLFVVIGSHVYILTANVGIELVPAHSYLNIIAGVLLMAGWLSRKA